MSFRKKSNYFLRNGHKKYSIPQKIIGVTKFCYPYTIYNLRVLDYGLVLNVIAFATEAPELLRAATHN